MDAVKAGIPSGTVAVQLDSPPKSWRVLLFGPRPNWTLCRVIVWSMIALLFFHHLLVPIQIIGSSMSPTYTNGSLNLVNKWSYSKGTPHRGDVIAVRVEGELLLKRIVALPGEIVAIGNGELIVNGRPLSDDFSYSKIPWEMDPVSLGQDQFFVIGDNRSESIFCKAHRKQILGRVVF